MFFNYIFQIFFQKNQKSKISKKSIQKKWKHLESFWNHLETFFSENIIF
jgi:hypothetical protein